MFNTYIHCGAKALDVKASQQALGICYKSDFGHQPLKQISSLKTGSILFRD